MFNKKIKDKVIGLRKKGHSFEEIMRMTGVSKSTLSLWLRGLELDRKAKNRILSLIKQGNKKAGLILSQRRIEREAGAFTRAQKTLSALPAATKEQIKLMCALIYYCEGSKSIKHGVTFTNSDFGLMHTFLAFLRKGFILDESRFRAHLHLHSYHNEKIQKALWARTMNVPESQFIKSFMKKESGLNIKKGYPGCVTIRYHDASIARELLSIAEQYFKNIK